VSRKAEGLNKAWMFNTGKKTPALNSTTNTVNGRARSGIHLQHVSIPRHSQPVLRHHQAEQSPPAEQTPTLIYISCDVWFNRTFHFL